MIGEGMTDREALLALLDRFQITPHADEFPSWPDPDSVVLTAKHGGVEGYAHFYAQFEFEADGAFRLLAIAE